VNFNQLRAIKDIPSMLSEILQIDFAVHLMVTQFNYLVRLLWATAAVCMPE
jgi:hypothetical protein